MQICSLESRKMEAGKKEVSTLKDNLEQTHNKQDANIQRSMFKRGHSQGKLFLFILIFILRPQRWESPFHGSIRTANS